MNGDDDALLIEEWGDDQSVPETIVGNQAGSTDAEEEADGLDLTTSTEWIYPINYPVRDYQKNIVTNALFKNTLVSLPTGLGKTFIAAVLMYNFHRWYPSHKVVFMAHSKPLVAQQVQACCDVMGIPQKVTAELNGTISLAKRKQHWENRRIFFLTPQVFNNDLGRGLVSPESIRCVVIDEAHKALGNQAYCQAVKSLKPFNRNFRVLALSATPGDDIAAVKAVIENLLISHLELRTEDDADIKKYLHGRKVDTVVVSLDSKIIQYRDQLLAVADKYLRHLVQAKAITGSFGALNSFSLVLKQKQFLSNPSVSSDQRGLVLSNFSVAISLLKASEELVVHGLRSFLGKLLGIKSGEGATNNVHSRLAKDAEFAALAAAVEDYIGKDRDVAFDPNVSMARLQDELDAQTNGSLPPLVYSHPKFVTLEQIVTEHFGTWSDKNQATKVIVFCKSRPCTGEICNFLNRFRPLVKPMILIGQSSSTGGSTSRGLKQSAQLEVMRKFRTGVYNTLVATCVGEEGLDVGEVDLIINFDASKNSNTQVQRAGRTGRKREGRVVNLVTEGKEYQDYNVGFAKAKTMSKKLSNGMNNLPLYPNSPRLLPRGVDPVCQEMFLKAPTETPGKKKTKSEETPKKPPSKRRKKDPAQQFLPSQTPQKPPSKRRKNDPQNPSQSSKKYDIRYALSQGQKNKGKLVESQDDSSGSLFEAAGAVQLFKDGNVRQDPTKASNIKNIARETHVTEESRVEVPVISLDDSESSQPNSCDGFLLNEANELAAKFAAVSLPLNSNACDILDTLSIDELMELAAKNFKTVRIADGYKINKITPIIGNPWRESSECDWLHGFDTENGPLDVNSPIRRSFWAVPISREEYFSSISVNRSVTVQTSKQITGFDDLWDTSLKDDDVSVLTKQNEVPCKEPVIPVINNCDTTSDHSENSRISELCREDSEIELAATANEDEFALGNCVESTRLDADLKGNLVSESNGKSELVLPKDAEKTDIVVNHFTDDDVDVFIRPQTSFMSERNELNLQALAEKVGSNCLDRNKMDDSEDAFLDDIRLTHIVQEAKRDENTPRSLIRDSVTEKPHNESCNKSTVNTNNCEVSMVTVTQALGIVASFKAKHVNPIGIAQESVSSDTEMVAECKGDVVPPLLVEKSLPNTSLTLAFEDTSIHIDKVVNNASIGAEIESSGLIKQPSNDNGSSSPIFKVNRRPSRKTKKNRLSNSSSAKVKPTTQSDCTSSIFQVSQKYHNRIDLQRSPVFNVSQRNRRHPLKTTHELLSKDNEIVPLILCEEVSCEVEKPFSARKSLNFAETAMSNTTDSKTTKGIFGLLSDSDDDLFLEAEKELKIMQTQQLKENSEVDSSDKTQIYTPERISPSVLHFVDEFQLPSSVGLENSSTPLRALIVNKKCDNVFDDDDDLLVPCKLLEKGKVVNEKLDAAKTDEELFEGDDEFVIPSKLIAQEREDNDRAISECSKMLEDDEDFFVPSKLFAEEQKSRDEIINKENYLKRELGGFTVASKLNIEGNILRAPNKYKENNIVVTGTDHDFTYLDCSKVRKPENDTELRKSDSLATCDDSMPFGENLATYRDKLFARNENAVKTPPRVAIVRPITSQTSDKPPNGAGWILSTANKPKSPSLLSILKPTRKRKKVLSSQSQSLFTPKNSSASLRRSFTEEKKINKSPVNAITKSASSDNDVFATFDCIPDDLADFLTCSTFDANKQSTPISKSRPSTSTKEEERTVKEDNRSSFKEKKRARKVGTSTATIDSDGNLSDDALAALRAVEEFERNQRVAETSTKSAKSGVDFDVWGSDDSDDFFEKKVVTGQPARKETASPRKKTKKRLGRKRSNQFIVREAELSDDDGAASSDDEDDSDLDEMDSSFLDERIAPTQAPDVDMTARYLSTVRSPPVVAGGFKIPQAVTPNFPVCSQYDPNDDDYERDSFCVDDAIEENNDLSALELAELILDRRRKRRRMETPPSSKQKSGKKKRRRIVVVDSSSEDEVVPETAVSKAVSKPSEMPLVSTIPSSSSSIKSSAPVKLSAPPLVFIGSRQIASTPDITTALRAKWKFQVEVRSSPGADYIVSWRVGINRITLSDFCNGSPIIKASLKEATIKLLELFTRPVLIIEDDKNKAAPRTVGCHRDLWAKHSAKRLARLRHADVATAFTKDKEETAKVIAQFAQEECQKGHGIVTDWKNISPALETKLKFYCSLPGVNVANALRVCRKFSTLSSFLSVCDSAAAIKRELGVPQSAAVNIYHALHSASTS